MGAMGGTGKTQLAVAVAHTLWNQRAVDLLVWVTASGRDAILTGYAQALRDVGAPDPGEGPQVAASHLLAWLAETGLPWLVVLDDLNDAAVLEGLWPWGVNGRVVVTTSRPDTAVRRPAARRGGRPVQPPRAWLPVPKLHEDPDQWIGALDLALDLGFLPIALAQAGALMADAGIDCRQYRTWIAEQRQQLGTQAGAKSTVAATGALALELANQRQPAALARPMLALTSMLDPNGIPGAVLTSPASCAFLTQARGATPVDEAQARTAVHTLGRLGPGRHRHQRCRRTGCGFTSWSRRPSGRASPPPSATRPPGLPPTRYSRPGRCRPCRPRSTRPCATARPSSAR
jgi:hypothetical protein